MTRFARGERKKVGKYNHVPSKVDPVSSSIAIKASSSRGTVFALLFFRLEKLLFYTGIFFQCSVFFICPPLVQSLFVYGICLRNSPNIFLSLRVSSPFRSVASVPRVRRSARTCALDARVSARVVRAKPSERAASFCVHTGRNVWLWLKVEKLFRFHFSREKDSSRRFYPKK